MNILSELQNLAELLLITIVVWVGLIGGWLGLYWLVKAVSA